MTLQPLIHDRVPTHQMIPTGLNSRMMNQEHEIRRRPQTHHLKLPVPDDSDIDLICEEYWHLDQDQAWCFKINVYQQDINRWHREENPHHMAFLVSAAKRQRSEVKLATLSPEQQQQFAKAKMNEIDSWLATETVTKVLRH